MNVALVNQSAWSTESLQAIVDFLAPCYGHVDMPVVLTVKSKSGYGAWGKAFFPRGGNSRCIKKGHYAVTLYIGTHDRSVYRHQGVVSYPVFLTYKKRAGSYLANSKVDEVVHTMAHELRHVEQFETCRLALGIEDTNKFTFDMQAGRWAGFGTRFRNWEHSTRSGFKYGSCEYDAEVVAHGLLAAYQFSLERRFA